VGPASGRLDDQWWDTYVKEGLADAGVLLPFDDELHRVERGLIEWILAEFRRRWQPGALEELALVGRVLTPGGPGKQNHRNEDTPKGLHFFLLNVLIYQNRVSIWINDHKASRASRVFVCF
jgi:hypothetical protein